MTKRETLKHLRARRAVLLDTANDILGMAMRISHDCPLTAEQIKDAQFLIDDALTLSKEDR